MESPMVEVVVIGGGVQGPLILDGLIEAGYSCALVTEGDLGSGQTLHSHGFLNTGYGMSGAELPQAAELGRPYLRARGGPLTRERAIIPPPGFRAFASLPPASRMASLRRSGTPRAHCLTTASTSASSSRR